MEKTKNYCYMPDMYRFYIKTYGGIDVHVGATPVLKTAPGIITCFLVKSLTILYQRKEKRNVQNI